MPTGYTEIIEERGDVTFEEFVWRCARAMGALIMMRDEPLSAPIPERFEPGDYNKKAADRARELLARLEKMTPEEAERASAADHEKAAGSRHEFLAASARTDLRYHSMLEKVRAWEPPTAEHDGLKRFMLEQLEMSLSSGYSPPQPKRIPGAEWLKAEKERAEKDVAYHLEEHRKEVERTESRNEWLAQLRKSVPPPLAARGK